MLERRKLRLLFSELFGELSLGDGLVRKSTNMSGFVRAV